MKYVVLYGKNVSTAHIHNYYGRDNGTVGADMGSIRTAWWSEFDDKKEAIEFARQNEGVIVEGFAFDIVKDKKL